MQLLALPAEIFEKIVYEAILARGLGRGIRLRLVNKHFSQAVWHVVCTFRMLDTLFTKPERKTKAISKSLLRDYLEHRILHEPAYGKPVLVFLRRLLEEVQRERTTGFIEAIDVPDFCLSQFCLAMVYNNSVVYTFRQIFEGSDEVSDTDYESHLFAAALCTNSLAIAKRCAAKNPHFISSMHRWNESHLFGSYLSLAARYGDFEMLEFLMSDAKGSVNRPLRTMLFIRSAELQRAEVVRFVYNHRKEEVPWEFGQQSEEFRDEGEALDKAMLTTSSEVLQFVERLRQEYLPWPHPEPYLKERLRDAAQVRNFEMVVHLLAQGANAQGGMDLHPPYVTNGPIEKAAQRGITHWNVIELLIKHGADPNVAVAAAVDRGKVDLLRTMLEHGLQPPPTFQKPTFGPFLDIVRLLLKVGTSVDLAEPVGMNHPLVGAIKMEHTALFDLLIKSGVKLHAPGIAEACVQIAKKDGLESMLQLLQKHGVEITVVDDDTGIAN
ncbi:hypothetical protein FB567DRAFT_533069 [Paraphoma chrysanthemicola]|uniref:Ankyrin n=1 Tax=Paraphoma chrysanthemicola TaxID=798071 RepID=A0A8K0R100_9PLEO|nr:hypothetical protein FB567DRAFT_533069 [Paraphoma chrysanthemicola]